MLDRSQGMYWYVTFLLESRRNFAADSLFSEESKRVILGSSKESLKRSPMTSATWPTPQPASTRWGPFFKDMIHVAISCWAVFSWSLLTRSRFDSASDSIK